MFQGNAEVLVGSRLPAQARDGRDWDGRGRPAAYGRAGPSRPGKYTVLPESFGGMIEVLVHDAGYIAGHALVNTGMSEYNLS